MKLYKNKKIKLNKEVIDKLNVNKKITFINLNYKKSIIYIFIINS